METNDHLIAVMIVGNQNEKNAAAIELRRRGIDVERLKRDYIPQFLPHNKRPAVPKSRSEHRSSFKSVTRYYPDGTKEIATSLDFESRYEDF